MPVPSGGTAWGEAELPARVVTIQLAYSDARGELEAMNLELELGRMSLRLCKTTLGLAEARLETMGTWNAELVA